MLSLEDQPVRLCDGISRREWLRVGGLSVVGLALPQLLAAEARSAPATDATSRLSKGLEGATFGRAKNVIFLWLQGGPPQHETFDPKPDAPTDIRGPFKPIASNVPGIRFCELLPRTARMADKLAIVRSIATDDNNHDVSGYWVLTGYPYGPGSARQIKPNDWPYFGSIVKMLKPSQRLPALTSVWVPDVMRLNDNVTPAGQTAGFLSKLWEPARFIGDPAAPDYRLEGLALRDELTPLRLNQRRTLLGQLDRHFRQVERGGAIETWDRLSQHAYDLVSSGKARAAFDLSKEPDAVRERYGRQSWGQTVLLARRLIEAGVRLVHVNWTREAGDSAVDNPMWDTHAQNGDRLQDFLCPQFDVGFTALIEDLAERGLLSETLVVAIGEFGRTPRINQLAGRDHWGSVFSFALAGAGIRGGQVLGASDKNGAFPAMDPIRPHDLTATLFHLLGIDPQGVFHDKSNQPHPLTRGEPLYRVLGPDLATRERCAPGGDLAFVPPYDPALLMDTDFHSDRPLVSADFATRAKGWRATPVCQASLGNAPCVSIVSTPKAGSRFAVLGFGLGDGSKLPAIAQGARAILAQEIRSARGGHYTFTARISGGGTSAEVFERLLLNHFTCRLVLFRFPDVSKDPRRVQELASVTFRPAFGEEKDARTFTVSRFLGSTQPGANFAIGNGLGVAVVLEKTSTQNLEWLAGGSPSAFIRVHSVALDFSARPRDDSVVD
jgi:hypothetical protein